ncbi:MAG: hypothetical protein ACR2GA_04945 [Chloroflexota bacterium]
MFVVGLLIGPAIGTVVGDLSRRYAGSVWRTVAGVALLIVFLLFAPFFQIELKIGLICGTLLGLLLEATPLDLTDSSSPV